MKIVRLYSLEHEPRVSKKKSHAHDPKSRYMLLDLSEAMAVSSMALGGTAQTPLTAASAETMRLSKGLVTIPALFSADLETTRTQLLIPDDAK